MDFSRPIAMLCHKISIITADCLSDDGTTKCACASTDGYIYYSTGSFQIVELYYGAYKLRKVVQRGTDHFRSMIGKLSSRCLLEILYQLIPFSQHTTATNVLMPEITTLIRGLEREMSLSADDRLNYDDVVKANRELKTENARLISKIRNATLDR